MEHDILNHTIKIIKDQEKRRLAPTDPTVDDAHDCCMERNNWEAANDSV